MRRAGWIVAAVAVSAVLLVLALPPADLGPLAFVALVPVMLAVRGKGFAVGFAGGMGVLVLGSFVTRWGWFYEPSIQDGDPGWNHLGFALFGVAVGLSCALVGETKRTTRITPWTLAAFSVLFEFLLFIYLPAHLALTQYRVFAAMKIASLAGIWGVSFFVWLVNYLFVFGFTRKSRWTPTVVGVVLGAYIGLSALAGNPRVGSAKVGVVQTATNDIERLAELSLEASSKGAEIVVWPELSGLVAAPGGDTTELRDLAMSIGQAPFVTTYEDGARPLPYNVASLFTTQGESGLYKKRKLFGAERTMHGPGAVPVSAKWTGHTYGLNICFDSCFPAVMRETAALEGVDMILLPSLDPVAPYGTVQAYHAAYTPFRAAELGVPIVRADTTAYSMVVDARGVIVREAGSGTEEVFVTDVDFDRRNTLYRKFGDWFLHACFALADVGSFVAYRGRGARVA